MRMIGDSASRVRWVRSDRELISRAVSDCGTPPERRSRKSSIEQKVNRFGKTPLGGERIGLFQQGCCPFRVGALVLDVGYFRSVISLFAPEAQAGHIAEHVPQRIEDRAGNRREENPLEQPAEIPEDHGKEIANPLDEGVSLAWTGLDRFGRPFGPLCLQAIIGGVSIDEALNLLAVWRGLGVLRAGGRHKHWPKKHDAGDQHRPDSFSHAVASSPVAVHPATPPTDYDYFRAAARRPWGS